MVASQHGGLQNHSRCILSIGGTNGLGHPSLRNAHVGLFRRMTAMMSMGDLQDPKMEVLYHIRPYFGGIHPYIGLT